MALHGAIKGKGRNTHLLEGLAWCLADTAESDPDSEPLWEVMDRDRCHQQQDPPPARLAVRMACSGFLRRRRFRALSAPQARSRHNTFLLVVIGGGGVIFCRRGKLGSHLADVHVVLEVGVRQLQEDTTEEKAYRAPHSDDSVSRGKIRFQGSTSRGGYKRELLAI